MRQTGLVLEEFAVGLVDYFVALVADSVAGVAPAATVDLELAGGRSAGTGGHEVEEEQA